MLRIPASFTIQDNVSTPNDITGLFFNSSLVRAVNISYAAYRSSNALYTFTIAGSSSNQGDTYSDGVNTYSVLTTCSTLATSIVLELLSGSVVPASGVLTRTYGVGPTTITFSATTNVAGIAESGSIMLDLNDNAPVGSKWHMSQLRNGDAGIAFSVTDGGQIQYTSSALGLTGNTGILDFSAKTLTK